MAFQYVAYNTRGQMVKGKLQAATEKAASELLTIAGYQVINLKPYVPFYNKEKLIDSMYKVKTPEVVLLFRQLSMLLQAGTNIGSAIEMLQEQSNNPLLKKTLREVVADVRGGNQLSKALAGHPKIFPSVYCQLLGIGEESGDLENLLKQVADYMEKEEATTKETKSALMMPFITAIAAVVVVGLMITFVLPSFAELYTSLGVKLPPIARAMIGFGNGMKQNGLLVLLVLAAISGGIFMFIKTPRGRYQLDKLLLHIPLLGKIRLLNELAHYCRSMSLLFRTGIPLSEVMPMVIKSSSNKVLAEALTQVEKDMNKGEGLSRPMSKNKLFLPMMVQMVKVGEETGSLDATLQAVAESYESESGERMHSLIALIQPAMTLGIGAVVALIAVTLISSMTAMYGQF
jgi:type IV pilus assembly protein PilC